jgi:hypothetical protein
MHKDNLRWMRVSKQMCCKILKEIGKYAKNKTNEKNPISLEKQGQREREKERERDNATRLVLKAHEYPVTRISSPS